MKIHTRAPMSGSEKRKDFGLKRKRPTYPLCREVCRSVCRYMSFLIVYIIAQLRSRVKLISCFRQQKYCVLSIFCKKRLLWCCVCDIMRTLLYIM